MKPQPSPSGHRMVRLLAVAAGACVAGSLTFITFVTLTGPWLGCVWLPAERPTIDVVFPNSPAALAGLRAGDRLNSADGLSLSSQWTASYFEANLEPGRTVQLEVQRSGLTTRLSITPVRASILRPDGLVVWLDLVVGWFTCALAFWIAFRRWGHLSALLASATLIAQAVIFTGCNAHGFAAAWRGLAPGLRHLVALPAALGWFFAPMLLLFVLEFPRRWRSLLPACACLPLALLSPLLVYCGLYGSLAKHPEVAMAAPLWLAPAAMAALWAVLFATVGVGIGQYRRETDLNHRRRLKIILCGVLISTVGSLAETGLSANGWRWLNSSTLLSARASCTLLNASMALSFAYAVLRHRLFDLSIIIRLGIRYALSKGLILSVAPACAILFIADVWRQSERPLAQVIREESNGYLILALVAVLAHTGRRRWLSALDRRFYRSRCDGRRVLSKLISNLRNPASREAVAAVALNAISEALHPKWAAIAGREHGGEARCLAALPEDRSVPLWIVESPPAVLSRKLAKPVHVGPDATWLEDLSPEYSAHMREAGAELLAPVIEGPDSDLLIILGVRRSDEPYSEEDLELLIAVGHSLELAMAKSLTLISDTSRDKQYSFGPFMLDPAARMLRRNGEIVPVGAKPFDLLVFLVERRGQVLSKENLLRGVWPESLVEEANLAQNVSFLRRILGEKAGENRYISTLSGRGYSFVAIVQQFQDCNVLKA
jgi:DNA-binding winged helix-turn-helix (wHTH) protein